MRRSLLLQHQYPKNSIVCEFNITSIEQPVRILGEHFDFSQIDNIIIDGIYQDSVKDTYTLNSTGKHIVVLLFDNSNVTNLYGLFAECANLAQVKFNSDLSYNTSLNRVFVGCSNLSYLDISMLNTSSVLTTEYMCYGCENLVSINMHDNNFNSVTTMEAMFSKCSNLVYMDTMYMSTTSNLTNLFAMFNECSSLNDVYLGNIDTTNVTNMQYMFSYCQKLEKVMFYSPIDNVQEIYGMFQGITTNGILYYNSSYDYSKMIAELPSTWTTSNEI